MSKNNKQSKTKQEEKENYKKIRHALNTLLGSSNLTEKEKGLVNDLLKASNATYEIEGLDVGRLGDVLANLDYVANDLKFLYEIEHGAIVSVECPNQFGDTVLDRSKDAIEHYNEAMRMLAKYVKGFKYEPIRLN